LEDKAEHVSVLLEETIEALSVKPDGVYCDATAGKRGGFAKKILEKLATGMVVGLDADPEAVESLKADIGGDRRARIYRANFRDMRELWEEEGLPGLDGVVMDLGLSTEQLADPRRGFSFSSDGPLNMKYWADGPGPTAADIVNEAAEEELTEMFFRWGERHARRIARGICDARRSGRIETTGRLAEVARKSAPSARGGRDASTLIFLALRAEANRELEALEKGVRAAVDLMNPGGVLCVITYQSAEDGLVKRLTRRMAKGCRCDEERESCVCGEGTADIELVNKKVIVPTKEEIARNRRARSAKLRIVRKLTKEPQ